TAKTISQIAVDKEIHADQGASDMREGDDPNIKDQKSEKGKSVTVHGKYTETECEAESHQKDSSFDSVSPTPSPPNGYQSSSRIAQLHDGDDQLDLEISLYDNDSGSPNNASPTGAGKFSLLKGRREKPEKAASYAHLLVPGNGLDSDEYNPVLLDDPTLKMGRRRRMISLLPFMGSNTQYTRSSEQKREANEKFRKRHPYLDPTMSL
ncbi:422_t:CDS:2, partial [Paraglomus occultum]